MTSFFIYAIATCHNPADDCFERTVVVRFIVAAKTFEGAIGRVWAWAEASRWAIARELSYESYEHRTTVDLRRASTQSTQPPSAQEAA